MPGRNLWNGQRAFRAFFRSEGWLRAERDKRFLKQMMWEQTQGELRWYKVEDGRAWKAHKQKLWSLGVRFKSIPQPGGLIVVIAAGQRGDLLPEYLGGILRGWLKQVPSGRKVSGSYDFGGPFSGSRAKPKNIRLGYTLGAFWGVVKGKGWPCEQQLSEDGDLTGVDLPKEYDERVKDLIAYHRRTFDWTAPGVYDS